ncbi:aldehyde dehydrogenase family protein, partial [Streptomyces sp. SID10244]|nr:aldehyde dehydrogenase family protein [Streptomyces sp. SID10244]
MTDHIPVSGANYIGGQWIPATSGKTFDSTNPADPGQTIGTFPESGPDDVAGALDALVKAAPEWADTPPERRARILEGAAADLESRGRQLIEEIVREEGKTRAEATMEVGRTPMNLRFYAAEAVRAGGSTYPAAAGSLVYTVREPVGCVGAITP